MSVPVLLLAFADPTGELNLAKEYHAVRGALRDRLGLAGRDRRERWDAVSVMNATRQMIAEELDARRDRVVGFHFGGHATSDVLLLEDAEGRRADAYGPGFARLLGAHRSHLQFVFLNACSTAGHVAALKGAGVPAVIATSRRIEDCVAIELSDAFYRALAGGAGLERAWEHARGCVEQGLAGPRAAYRAPDASDGDDGDGISTDGWPWSLTIAPGADQVRLWSLGAAIGDDTLGLPELPDGLTVRRPPFRRLTPFTADDALLFFGRGAEVHALYDRIKNRASAPVQIVHGQSGAGKSSLLDAGLVPRLQREFRVDYRRRADALGLGGTLRAALDLPPDACPRCVRGAWRRRSTRERPLVVILDQAEEAYTRAARGAAGDEELSALARDLDTLFGGAARPEGKLVLSLRKEWLPEIVAPLARLNVSHAELFVTRLGERGVVDAIVGPARIADIGLAVDEPLARRIARDLLADAESPVAPTLGVLLSKMWEAADGPGVTAVRFTETLYEQVCASAGLGAFVDEQLDALGTDFGPAVASGLALDVLAYHTTPRGTAQRREWAELAAAYQHVPELRPLVERMVSLSLLAEVVREEDAVGDAGARMLAHDTLAPIVRDRYAASVRPAQLARRVLERRAEEWAERAPPDGATLGDADLAHVEAAERAMRAWTPLERTIVGASRTARARRLRAGRRARAGWATVVAVIVGLGLLGNAQYRLAGTLRDRTTMTAAQAQREPVRAALVVGAMTGRGEQERFVDDALALAAEPVPWRVLDARAGALTALALGPDDRTLAVGSADGTVALWRLDDSATAPRVLATGLGEVHALAFDRSGARLAAASGDGAARVWTLGDGAAVTLPHPKPFAVLGVALAGPRGDSVVTLGEDAVVRVWSAAGGAPLLRPVDLDAGAAPVALALDPAGRLLATVSPDLRLRLWDWPGRTGQRPRAELEVNLDEPGQRGGDRGPRRVAFSPDGGAVVVATASGALARWRLPSDPANPSPDEQFEGGGRPVNGVAYAADGRVVVSASDDSTAAIVNLQRQVALAFRHPARVSAVALSRDGRWLVTAADDGRARVWRAAGSPAASVWLGAGTAVTRLAFDAAGRRVLAVTAGGAAFVTDVEDGAPLVPLAARDVVEAALSADGERAATLAADDTVRFHNAATPGEPPSALGTAPAGASRLRVDDDRRYVAVTLRDGRRMRWSTDGREVARVDRVSEPPPVEPWAATLGAGDTLRVTASAGGATRRVRLPGAVADAGRRVFAVSRDGARVAEGDARGRVRVFRVLWPDLVRTLGASTTVCLDASERGRLLGESAEDAGAAARSCAGGAAARAAAPWRGGR